MPLAHGQKCQDAVSVWAIRASTADNATVFSTSTRNFNNRMGKGAQVYLGSAELAAVCSLLGRIPTVPEYLDLMSKKINPFAGDLYRYLNFDQISGFEDEGRTVSVDEVRKLAEV
jgi:aconitate hydratase 2 / 2-methylisocitrate dehydratase